MRSDDIPDKVKNFIFRYVDSVQQLEILQILKASPVKHLSVEAINHELRANVASIAQRMEGLVRMGVVSESETTAKHYQYDPREEGLAGLIDDLLEAYDTKPHRILELIYSPMKKAFDFADAFKIGGGKKGEGEESGENNG